MAAMTEPKGGSGTYSFSSQPKPVGATRKKYRDPNEAVDATMFRDPKETGIQWDKRVHRGNTYSMYTQNAIKEALEQAENPPQPEPRRKRRPKEKSLFDMGLPEKERIPVDLTNNLVAKEQPPTTEHVEAQTDEFLPEPPAEELQPQKTGVDATTQVEDGELFVFDYQVEPILEVLCHKTLEQSVMEVEEEFELEQMTSFKTEWFKRQAAMMKDWEAQVAEEWVRWREKEAVVNKKREEKRKEAQVLLKIQAMAASKAHLKDLVPNAVNSLTEVAFPDMKGVAINRTFLPQVLSGAREQVKSQDGQDKAISSMVKTCMKRKVTAQKAARKTLVDKFADLERIRLEEMKIRRGSIRIYIENAEGEQIAVGPVQIESNETVEELQERIFNWLQDNHAALATSYQFGVMMCIRNDEGDLVPVEQTAQLFEAKAGQISMLPASAPEAPPPEEENAEGEENPEGEEPQ